MSTLNWTEMMQQLKSFSNWLRSQGVSAPKREDHQRFVRGYLDHLVEIGASQCCFYDSSARDAALHEYGAFLTECGLNKTSTNLVLNSVRKFYEYLGLSSFHSDKSVHLVGNGDARKPHSRRTEIETTNELATSATRAEDKSHHAEIQPDAPHSTQSEFPSNETAKIDNFKRTLESNGLSPWTAMNTACSARRFVVFALNHSFDHVTTDPVQFEQCLRQYTSFLQQSGIAGSTRGKYVAHLYQFGSFLGLAGAGQDHPAGERPDGSGKKLCAGVCGRWKDAAHDFYPRQAKCKDCYNLRQRQNYHSKNPEARIYKQEDERSQELLERLSNLPGISLKAPASPDPTFARGMTILPVELQKMFLEANSCLNHECLIATSMILKRSLLWLSETYSAADVALAHVLKEVGAPERFIAALESTGLLDDDSTYVGARCFEALKKDALVEALQTCEQIALSVCEAQREKTNVGSGV